MTRRELAALQARLLQNVLDFTDPRKAAEVAADYNAKFGNICELAAQVRHGIFTLGEKKRQCGRKNEGGWSRCTRLQGHTGHCSYIGGGYHEGKGKSDA